ncbi:MAG: hypothetical protein WBP64_14930 [Nitrososphaeraceae archaeon]
MSDLAYQRFVASYMLTTEEQQHRDEILTYTEDVLQAKGIECDNRISELSKEQLKEILEEVRRLRDKKKNKKKRLKNDSDDKEELEGISVMSN